jgi:chromosome segregation ATPase
MADTTDIEKKSLEAHVELCAQRYKFLEDKLESVEDKCVTLVASISSLEAHVELCAERYRFLEEKLESMEEKLVSVVNSVSTVKDTVTAMSTKNNDRLINWGIGIIVSLIGTVAWMLQHYVLK